MGSYSHVILFSVGRIQFNSEEQWTKALKFLLTNLKWGLAWVSSQFSEEQAELGADGATDSGEPKPTN